MAMGRGPLPPGAMDCRTRGRGASRPIHPGRDFTAFFVLLLLLPILSGCGLYDEPPTAGQVAVLTGGEAENGHALIRAYGCDACHTIPGVPGADRLVGPSLAGLSRRMMLGGVLPNTPENLVRWIIDPPTYAPGTAMPVLGVTDRDARDIAAYLLTLE